MSVLGTSQITRRFLRVLSEGNDLRCSLTLFRVSLRIRAHISMTFAAFVNEHCPSVIQPTKSTLREYVPGNEAPSVQRSIRPWLRSASLLTLCLIAHLARYRRRAPQRDADEQCGNLIDRHFQSLQSGDRLHRSSSSKSGMF
jgi:hypothetical protein